MTAAQLAEAMRFARAALVRLDEAAVVDLESAEMDRIAAAAWALTEAVSAACARQAAAVPATGAMLADPAAREEWAWLGALATVDLGEPS